MTTDVEEFFRKRKDAAVIKHDILAGYLLPYVMKTGLRSPCRRVSYIDGYAGPGVYDNEEPGSPEVAIQVGEAVGRHREFGGHFIEQRLEFVSRLEEHLAERAATGWKVHPGTAEEKLPAALDDVGTDPVLVFLDPYGLALPFDQLVGLLFCRQHTTEVVINFSLAALQRLGGFLGKDYWPRTKPGPVDLFGEPAEPAMSPERAHKATDQRDQMVGLLDEFLGGDWWQAIKRSGDPVWRERVRDEYVRRLCEAGGRGWMNWAVSIPEKFDGKPVYDLLLFTRHPHGLWLFNDASSIAYFKHYRRAWAEGDEFGAASSLFGDAPPPDLGQKFETRIRENVLDAVRAGRSFVVAKAMDTVFGDDVRGEGGGKACPRGATEPPSVRPDRRPEAAQQGTGGLRRQAGTEAVLLMLGISSHVRPSSSRPPDFGRMPPHCLKKNATPSAVQRSRRSRTHSASIGR